MINAKMVGTAGLMAALALVGFASHAFAVPVCYLDDPNSLHGLQDTIQCGGYYNDFGANPTLCGHEVHGSSCVVEVFVDSAGSTNATCLTVGKGVTLQMNDHTIDCPDAQAPCGKAINVTASGSGADKVSLESGNITGCWNTAALNTNGSNSNLVDFIIDLTGGANCAGNGNWGTGNPQYDNAFTEVSRTIVSHTDNSCIWASNKKVSDSIVHDCNTGIYAVGGATIDHVEAIDNVDNLASTDYGASPYVSVKRSTIRYASHCNFMGAGRCLTTDITSSFRDLTGSFVDDYIFP